jgi:hypothetical protein
MADGKAIQCKTKGCNNPVLDGKYCLQCTQIRKENKKKGWAVAGAVGIPALGIAIKKGALKQAPKIAKAVVKIIFRG